MSFKGKVKSFRPEKGFGFIIDPKKGPDVFLLDKFCVDGKQPKQGDIVNFDKEPSSAHPGKFEARNVTGGTGTALNDSAEKEAACVEEQRREETCEIPPADTGIVLGEGAAGNSEVAGELENSVDDLKKKPCAGDFDSMRSAYDELGVDGYYKLHGERYTNPHEPAIGRSLLMALESWAPCMELPLRRVHDLACGSGEASAAFLKWSGCAGCFLDASDPYTYAAYEKRMGRPAYQWSFEDIAGGVLDDLQPYDLVIGSICLHLLENSFQHTTLAALARSCRMMIVVTPHKKPVIEASTGWRQIDEIIQDRLRVRLYMSSCARHLSEGDVIEESTYTMRYNAPTEEDSVEQQAADDSTDSIAELVANMSMHELRQTLIQRGLSTGGKRSEWSNRLIMAMEGRPEPEIASSNVNECEEVEHPEVEQLDDDDEDTSTELEESEEETENEEEEQDSVDLDEDCMDAAEIATRRAAVKIALAARRAAKQSNKRATAPKAKEDKQVATKKRDFEDFKHIKSEKTVEGRLQANFGQTKFIKP